MIRNDSQLRQTGREIERLRRRLVDLRRKKLGRELMALQGASLAKMIRDLEDQTRAYRNAVRGRVRQSLLHRLLSPAEQNGRPRIGEAMVLLRLARGMTQEALARKMGTRREVVARWERDDYEGYTLETLQNVFEALGCRFTIDVRVAG
jgi:DNA-binding XRE family transcriptional regulator